MNRMETKMVTDKKFGGFTQRFINDHAAEIRKLCYGRLGKEFGGGENAAKAIAEGIDIAHRIIGDYSKKLALELPLGMIAHQVREFFWEEHLS